jgi:hypothetical protein
MGNLSTWARVGVMSPYDTSRRFAAALEMGRFRSEAGRNVLKALCRRASNGARSALARTTITRARKALSPMTVATVAKNLAKPLIFERPGT